MRKSANQPEYNPNVVIADGEPVDLRNRYLAAILGWLVPGAGHFYQRRVFKGTIFCLCVVSSFLVGMLVAHGKCVYIAWNDTEHRWQFALQAGVGFAAVPAFIQARTGRNGNSPMFGESFLVGPRSTADLDRWNAETGSGFDMGTLYTMVAGLLNILAVCDAYAGPLPPPHSKRHAEDEAPEEKPENGSATVQEGK